MTLTEQWKKGELQEGWYYIKDENGIIYCAENCLNYDCINDKAERAFYYAETEIKEVLAPVPTYGEYQALLSDQLAKQEGEEIIAELEHENLLLKVANFELRNRLSTIRAFIKKGIDDDDTSFFDLLKKIEKVLPNE